MTQGTSGFFSRPIGATVEPDEGSVLSGEREEPRLFTGLKGTAEGPGSQLLPWDRGTGARV